MTATQKKNQKSILYDVNSADMMVLKKTNKHNYSSSYTVGCVTATDGWLGLAVGISATEETGIDSVLTQNVETFCTYVVLHA
jgi:hypothetical protein